MRACITRSPFDRQQRWRNPHAVFSRHHCRPGHDSYPFARFRCGSDSQPASPSPLVGGDGAELPVVTTSVAPTLHRCIGHRYVMRWRNRCKKICVINEMESRSATATAAAAAAPRWETGMAVNGNGAELDVSSLRPEQAEVTTCWNCDRARLPALA